MLRLPLKLEWLLLTALCLSVTGCHWFPRQDPFSVTARCQIPEEMSPHELVRHLNDTGATKLRAWRADNVTISSRSMPISPKATLLVEAPRNLRMTAHVISGINEVDLGSNDERFWFWTRQAKEPCILTAKHDQIAAAQQRLSIPFQPDWIIEALGVVPLDEQDVQFERLPQQPRGRKLGRLISNRVSAMGEPVRKVTTIDLCHGVILEHALYNKQNQLMARAALSEHHFEPATGAVIPNRIDLEWPQTNMAMTLSLGRIQVNPPMSPQMFTMLQMPNTPVIDLGKPMPGQRNARPHHQAVSLSHEVEDDALPPDDGEEPRGRIGAGEPRELR